ncbi:MAG: hypothetical protein HOV81_10770, partial [Kofleriaceae bacterium]|nr:hypothetical protein [Kofleriaceae bacterium]
GTRLSGSRLSGTWLPGTRLSGTRLSGPRLSGTRLSVVLLSSAMVFGAACTGGGRATTPKAEPPLEVKTYGPLGIKVDAKLSHQAVILGTDDKNGSTILPLVQGTGKATVDAMVMKIADKASEIAGGVSTVKLTTATNPDNTVRVGVFEEAAADVGSQWRAGVWAAAFVAATTLNKDLTDLTFSATRTGHVDGAAVSGHVDRAAASGHVDRAAASGHADGAAATGHVDRAAASGHVDGVAASGHVDGVAASGHVNGVAASGHDDGAAASGLLAGGFLAALTGAPIDESATLTGVVNPDGTIGPVAGLPEKVAAAIAKGKKRVGYPIGMRRAKSAKTGNVVDVEAYANSRGAKAIAIADVHEAYKLLTGKTLPAAVPVAESDMELPRSTQAAITDKYKAWQQKVANEWAAILQLESAGRLPPVLVYLRDHSKKYAEAAEALFRKDLVAPAYVRMLAAWAYASSANQIYEVLAKVRAGKLDDAVASLGAIGNLDAATGAVFEKIGAMRPTTMGGALEMVAAFRAALRGWSFEVFASKEVAATTAYVKGLAGTPAAQLGSPRTADELIAMVAPTVLYAKKTIAETTLATEELDFDTPNDVDYTCSVPNVQRIAASLSSTGGAVLEHVEALLVQSVAASAKLGEDEARRRVVIREPDYLVATMTSKLATAGGLVKELHEKWGETSLAWSLLALAGSELAYFHATELVAKYDSLGVTISDSGEVTAIEREKAFSAMLDNAERNARANARAAQIATGAIPVQAKLAYQLAAVERDGTVAEKLDALDQLWLSSAISQTAVMLARN